MLGFEGNLLVDLGFMAGGAIVWHFTWKSAIGIINLLKTDLSGVEARIKALEVAIFGQGQAGPPPAVAAASATAVQSGTGTATPPPAAAHAG